MNSTIKSIIFSVLFLGILTSAFGDTVAECRTRARQKLKAKDWDGAISEYTKAIQMEPTNAYPARADHYEQRGEAKVEKKDWDGALADFKSAFKLDPLNAVRLTKRIAGVFGERSESRFKQKDFDGAIADRTLAMSLRSKPQPSDYLRRGFLKLAKKDWAAAKADYDKAVELEPEWPHAYERRAEAREIMGDVAGAKADREKAIQLKPLLAAKHAEIEKKFPQHFIRAAVQAKKANDFAGALTNYSRAIELEAESETIDLVKATTYFARGEVKEKMGDMDGAKADYAKSAELEEIRDPDVYKKKAKRWAERKIFSKALTDYSKAIKLEAQLGNSDRLRAMTYLNRGDVKEKTGDLDGAKADYKKAIELDSNLDPAKLALDRLNK